MSNPNDQVLDLKIRFPLPDGRVLVQGPLSYNADGLATRHYAGFQSDPRFAKAIEAGLATIRSRRPDLQVAWRVYTVCWAAEHALQLQGDFIECGVFTGLYSRSICEYLDFAKHADRKMWLLDTFEGIDISLLTPAEVAAGVPMMNKKYAGDVYPEVVKTFAPFPNVIPVKGSVPGTLAKVTSEKFAYVSIDMNAAAPEVAAADFAWDRMVSGAVMVLDDYGWAPHREQRIALDAWAKRRGIAIFAMPTGQGLVLKP